MNYQMLENLGFIERTTRVTTGLIIALSVLFIPYEPTWMAGVVLTAIYPLLTGLLAIDPILALVRSIKLDHAAIRKSSPTATA